MNKSLKIASFLSIALLPSLSYGQDNRPDTIQSRYALDEIVVAAPKVIHKADMDLFIPSTQARSLSKNGLQLVSNLQIPTLTINEAFGTISSLGNNVEVRINGRKADVTQLTQLNPSNIKRVEWIDNPGLKYNGAYAVLNFIVNNPSLGGSLMTQAMPALTEKWGTASAALKLNNGRSQWGIDLSGKLTDIDTYREYHETFTYPDGSKLTRTESPTGGKTKNNFATANLSYSYIKPDTTVLFVNFGTYKPWGDVEEYNGVLSLSNNTPNIVLHDMSKLYGLRPAMSMYLEQHLGNKQIIAVDASASYYNGHSIHTYSERREEDGYYLSDVNTDIHDRNFAFGVDANYEKRWNKSKLTAGISYGGNRNRSTYLNLEGDVFHQRQDRVRFYGEYFQPLGKFSLTAGIGANYTSHKLIESNEGNDSWNLRPQLTIAYRHGNRSQWRLMFNSWQSSPSLSQTNVTPQQLDGFQWQIGNPMLSTYSTYWINLHYKFAMPRVAGATGIEAQTSPDAIAPFYQWQDDRLITSFENSRGRQWLSVYFAPQVELIPGWFNLQGNIRWSVTRTRGTGYELTRRNWSWDITAMASHWGWNLIVEYSKKPVTLIGERETWGEKISLAMLAYNLKQWQFGVGILCPFIKYDQGSQLFNRYNSNEQHMRLSMKSMPFVKIAYNLQWGHQKRGASKRVNADSSVETSKAGSR